MTVGPLADANGAGSGNAAGSPTAGPVKAPPTKAKHDNTQSDKAGSTKTIGAGSAASSGGPLSDVPLQLRKIDDNVKHLITADALKTDAESNAAVAEKNEKTEAERALSTANQAEQDPKFNEQLVGEAVEDHNAAKKILDTANQSRAKTHAMFFKVQSELHHSILNETNRLAGDDSPFSPGDPRASNARRAAERIDFAYSESPEQEPFVRDAIRFVQASRALSELHEASDALRQQHNKLTPAQEAEKKDIIADASNWVTEPRARDGFSLVEIKTKQFERLGEFLKDLKDEDGNLDVGLFADFIIQCAKDMHIISDDMHVINKDDLEKLHNIANQYSNSAQQKALDSELLKLKP